MSNVNYSLNNKGVRLVSAEDAWVNGKNGKYQLNKKYMFVGKLDLNMPNMVVSTAQGKKQKSISTLTERTSFRFRANATKAVNRQTIRNIP